MAQIVNGNQVKLDNGQVITPQTGGWYDGQQFWGGTLSQPGQINPLSNQQGAGDLVSKEVISQTNPANVAYLEQQRANMGLTQPLPEFGVSQAPGYNYTPGGAQAATSAASAFTAPQTASLNLPELYKSLYSSAGIQEKESELAALERQKTEVLGGINDNPYLSEATRVGRVAKVEELHGNRTQNLRDEIATKKADIETQMNLELKQFDINSQQIQLAWQQFNTLLQMGALDGATGDDIANITRATGISSDAVYSAINASKKSRQNTQLIQVDDGTSVNAVLVDTDTGAILNTTKLASSKPSAPKAMSDSERQSILINSAAQDARSGYGVRDIFAEYIGYIDPNTLLSIYNANSIYGPAKESAAELRALGVKIDDSY